MSVFEPAWLPEDRRLNGKASQTFLRHFNQCPRSGYLYALHKGEARTVEMVRGTAIHEVLARSTMLAVERDERYVPPEIVKSIVDEVLAEQVVPIEEHDYIREMAYRWAAHTGFPEPENVIACETLLVLSLNGWDVRMRVDYAEMFEGGAAVLVKDYKSAKGMPAQEEVARVRPDGTLTAKSFQLILYALGLAYGVPVRVEISPLTGEVVEICEPFPLAGRAQRFDLAFEFPGIPDRLHDDRPARREVSLTPAEMHAYLQSLEALLANLSRAESDGDWPAVVSDAACGECPSPMECPIPREMRDHRGTINEEHEAAEAMSKLDRERAEHAARMREIKAFVKHNGGALVFGDKIVELVPVPKTEIKDREGMFAQIERARLYGEPFDRSTFERSRMATETKVRDLTAEELAERAGRDGNGSD